MRRRTKELFIGTINPAMLEHLTQDPVAKVRIRQQNRFRRLRPKHSQLVNGRRNRTQTSNLAPQFQTLRKIFLFGGPPALNRNVCVNLIERSFVLTASCCASALCVDADRLPFVLRAFEQAKFFQLSGQRQKRSTGWNQTRVINVSKTSKERTLQSFAGCFAESARAIAIRDICRKAVSPKVLCLFTEYLPISGICHGLRRCRYDIGSDQSSSDAPTVASNIRLRPGPARDLRL